MFCSLIEVCNYWFWLRNTIIDFCDRIGFASSVTVSVLVVCCRKVFVCERIRGREWFVVVASQLSSPKPNNGGTHSFWATTGGRGREPQGNKWDVPLSYRRFTWGPRAIAGQGSGMLQWVSPVSFVIGGTLNRAPATRQDSGGTQLSLTW